MVSHHISLVALHSAAAAAQNIGPISMHLALLHRSNFPPIHGDLVCSMRDAWLYTVNVNHWETAVNQ